MTSKPADCLGAQLDHEPAPLQFGTSGRRGRLIHLTQLEVYINALAELEYLQSLPPAQGGIKPGEDFYFACDLRPSSRHFVPEASGHGELAQAIERAIRDAGMNPVNLGCIPTPALTYHALQRRAGSMMVTGSHIPFDWNGYKTNTSIGELRKADEAPIHRRVEQVRERLYRQPAAESSFDRQGRFKAGHAELGPETAEARQGYLARYADFFAGRSLKGIRLLVYQHSAVGRDLLVELLQHFGAETILVGRSESFVAIDTENMDARQLGQIQDLADAAWTEHGPLDAVVSTDGDSDRPLILGFERKPGGGREQEPGQVRFYGGDLAGMIVAEYLGADAVVVPITCNDAIDRGALRGVVEPKTRIGSPYVLAGTDAALAKGRKVVCGWEPNGGFLLASNISRAGKLLKALPTRDALLPILGVLFFAAEMGSSVDGLFGRLPKRYGRAGLLKNFPRQVGRRIVERFSPGTGAIQEIRFAHDRAVAVNPAGEGVELAAAELAAVRALRTELARFFNAARGFGHLSGLNYTDGVRLYFENEEVAHFRPSGNADELRIYAVANSQARADEIVQAGIAEPEGVLRQMERAVANGP